MSDTRYVFRMVEGADDDIGWGFSAQVQLEFEFPPIPKVIESKYALLKLCDPKSKAIEGVGVRKAPAVFYVRLTEDEYEQLKLELESRDESR
jgi:hypothetical protein